MNVTSKHLGRSTDLTVLMPLRPGLIPALDTMNYASRARRLMAVFNGLRVASREISAVRPLSDAVERIQAIHSFRLAVIEEQHSLLLAVTFDGPWEPYIRIIWRDLGAVMNPILCNCADYPGAEADNFPAFAEWIRHRQVDSEFFYAASGDSVGDLDYQRRLSALQLAARDAQAFEREATALRVPDPSAEAQRVAHNPANLRDTLAAGLGALSAIYDLRPYYLEPREQDWLLAAAHTLLADFVPIMDSDGFRNDAAVNQRFRDPIAWFRQRPAPASRGNGGYAALPAAALHELQGGIVEPYADVSRGCLALLRITEASAARAFLDSLDVTYADDGSGGAFTLNVALTLSGLRRLGMSQEDLATLPKAFREGMAARAGLLGDVRANHPLNWRLPPRNWPRGGPPAGVGERVPLSSVDIVVQLRTAAEAAPDWLDDDDDPLTQRLLAIDAMAGVQLLSVEVMARQRDAQGRARDHFGFVDGISQPVAGGAGGGAHWDDRVNAGECVLGYPNDRNDPPVAADSLLANGTFLVVRKLRQHVERLHRVVDAQQAALTQAGLSSRQAIEKMMGRSYDGEPLSAHGAAYAPGENDFDYADDPAGSGCPLQAHIRLANPRDPAVHVNPGKPRVPRILRRGMSYGAHGESAPAAERGLMFMAYNASIEEQFEVIQRWLSGANSSGLSSQQADPFLGVPQRGAKRTFRTEHGNATLRLDLDDGDGEPLVQLEWGAYLFVPGRSALRRLAGTPTTSDLVARGNALIERLPPVVDGRTPTPAEVDAWREVLESSATSAAAAALWAAVRARHGGVLRTPFGVLAGSQAAIDDVLGNDDIYSVCGYHERMQESIGSIYLGLDDGPQYRAQADPSNQAIGQVSRADAFAAAYRVTRTAIDTLVPAGAGPLPVTMTELSTQVLGELCTGWFGIPDGHYVELGAIAPLPGAPRCPGAFAPPSRYIFSPHPGQTARTVAVGQGRALHEAARQYVSAARGTPPVSDLAGALFTAVGDDDLLARTLIGVMMGFLPTVDGNFRVALFSWLTGGELWRLQEDFAAAPGADRLARANAALMPALSVTMQQRPVPGLIWRTARTATTLEGIAVHPGDRVVVGIASATQASLADHRLNVDPVFGGRRDGSAGPPPTHACPGYEMALGVMLGMIAGVLEAGTLYPASGPLTVRISR